MSRLGCLLCCVSAGLMVALFLWLLRLNLSPSVPRGLYRLTAVPAELHRGALVVLPVPASIQHLWPWWIPLLKPVAGVPGDVVCVHAGHLAVNTVDYGPVFLETQGKPVPHLDQGCQTVGAGQVFLASPVPKSLDGRYFGMTPMGMLTAQALPVLIWG